jgi:hypothetical protein
MELPECRASRHAADCGIVPLGQISDDNVVGCQPTENLAHVSHRSSLAVVGIRQTPVFEAAGIVAKGDDIGAMDESIDHGSDITSGIVNERPPVRDRPNPSGRGLGAPYP